MAINATMVWEVRIAGLSTNGGGFDPSFGGTDYSQQDSPQATGTATSSTTTLTATTGIFTAAMVGNVVTDGTTRKVITAYTNSTTVTLDSAPSWTAATIRVGGAASNLGDVISNFVAGNKCWVQKGSGAGTYSRTTTINLGTVAGTAAAGRVSIEGYGTTRGDRAGRPIITTSTTSVNLITANSSGGGSFFEWVHLKFTHTGATRGNALNSTGAGNNSNIFFKDCVFDGVLQAINANWTSQTWEGCEVLNCTSTTAAITLTGGVNVFTGCDIHNNAGDGVRDTNGYGNGNHRFDSCLITGNAGVGVNSVEASAVTIEFLDCLFVDNTGDAIKLASATTNQKSLSVQNCLFYGNTGNDINNLDNQTKVTSWLRFYRNNAHQSGKLSGIAAALGNITLTADPFSNRAGRVYTLNSTSGGGALLRAAGWPNNWPSGTTVGYVDVGPVQHQDSGGSVAFPTSGPGGME